MSRILFKTASVVALAVVLTLHGPGIAEDAQPKKTTRTPDSVYVATPHDVVTKMLDLAEIKKSDVIYDLGCGDGRIVAMAAHQYGCRGVGYDIDPQRVEESLETVKKYKVEHLVKIEQEDIFTLDLRPVSVIALYLLPGMNVKLIPQLEKLKPGSRIVAHDYGIREIEPEKVVTYTSNEDNVEHIIYFYTTPLKKETSE